MGWSAFIEVHPHDDVEPTEEWGDRLAIDLEPYHGVVGMHAATNTLTALFNVEAVYLEGAASEAVRIIRQSIGSEPFAVEVMEYDEWCKRQDAEGEAK